MLIQIHRKGGEFPSIDFLKLRFISNFYKAILIMKKTIFLHIYIYTFYYFMMSIYWHANDNSLFFFHKVDTESDNYEKN